MAEEWKEADTTTSVVVRPDLGDVDIDRFDDEEDEEKGHIKASAHVCQTCRWGARREVSGK